MRRNFTRILSAALSALMVAGSVPAHVFAAVENGWETVDGKKYWYESGVKQGLEGRGKEIYDPGSNAWYWLDSVSDGAMATGKDLYQESKAGQWAEKFVEGDWEASTGKWVRYDSEGHMVKGWYENENGKYYFDEVYGTMAKGYAVIQNENGQYIEYYFDTATGVLLRELGEVPEKGWKNVEGIDVWYENHIRQGYSIDASYRGKEIYDEGSDAWYWLDSVDGGKKATGKDVYQESKADDAGNIGKWVRYDENGHMIKGWTEKDGNKYYFDPVYGTMYKGIKSIDGKNYEFDSNTGVLIGEVNYKESLSWHNTRTEEVLADGSLQRVILNEFDAKGNQISSITKIGNKRKFEEKTGLYIYSAASEEDMQILYCYTYEYDDAGNMTKEHYVRYGEETSDEKDENGFYSLTTYLGSERDTTYVNGKTSNSVSTSYNSDGSVSYKEYDEYDAAGRLIKESRYKADGTLRNVYEYEYSGDNMVRYTYNCVDYPKDSYTYKYEYDADGNKTKEEKYNYKNEMVYYWTYTYENGKAVLGEKFDVQDNKIKIRYTYEYNDAGKILSEKHYNLSGDEFKLSSEDKYTYGDNGYDYVLDNYTYDSKGEAEISSREIRTYYLREYSDGRVSTSTKGFDIYNSRNIQLEDGTYGSKLGYTYGYEFISEQHSNGYYYSVQYISYTSDANYDKTESYHQVFEQYSFPSNAVEGQKFVVNPYTTTYAPDGTMIYKSVLEYTAKKILVK